MSVAVALATAGCVAQGEDVQATAGALACTGSLVVAAPAGLRLRGAPSADAPIVATLPDGTAVLADANQAPAGDWIAVRAPDTPRSGWVHGAWLRCEAASAGDACAALVSDYLAAESAVAGAAACTSAPQDCGRAKVSQYASAIVSEHGTMACGLVASTSALPEALRPAAMRAIRAASGPLALGGYGPSAGMQPTGSGAGLAAALRLFYGDLLVREHKGADLRTLHRELAGGHVVIVDLLESERGSVRVGSGAGSFAHFARALAIDPRGGGTIYLESSLSGPPVVSAPLQAFCDAWTTPERRAAERPAGVPLSDVTRWAVVIDRRALEPRSTCGGASTACGSPLGAAPALLFSCAGSAPMPVRVCARACDESVCE